MNRYNSIIIGSGLGGLTAGAVLAHKGCKVLVLEQHYVAGGCATAFKRGDYLMEVGLHEIDGLHEGDPKRDILEMLGVFDAVEFVKAPEFYALHKGDFEYMFPDGWEHSKGQLLRDFPEERQGIEAYYKLLRKAYPEALRFPKQKWLQVLTYPLVPLLFPNLVRASSTTVGVWMDKHIKSEQLKAILTANIGHYSDDPYELSMLLFCVAQSCYIAGGGHFIKGGSQRLSNYLVQYIEARGGQVLLGKMVDKILIEKGKAVGVAYRDTFNEGAGHEEAFADVVIANAAQPNVVAMLPEKEGARLHQQIKDLKPSCGLLTIYLGFNTDLKAWGVRHYSTFIQGEEPRTLKEIKANNQGDYRQRSFIFLDYSQIDAQLAPQGKSVAVICTTDYLSEWSDLDAATYEARKEALAQSYLQRLEAVYPHILEHLEYYEVGTAKTIARYTLNPHGTPYGYAQSREQSGPARVKATASPVKRLYFASAWSPTGGGYTGAIFSGYLTAEGIKGVPWRKLPPSHIEDTREMRLLSKEMIAENTVELTFEKPKDLQYAAGQYAVVKLSTPAYTALDLPWRPLSMVSHPDEEVLRFAMRLSDSSYKKSVAAMQVGDRATIFAPMATLP